MRVPVATFASISGLVVARSLRELVRYGRLNGDCSLRFTYQNRTAHSADLVIEDRAEETPRGMKRTIVVKIVDCTTKESFTGVEEWAADCLCRNGKKVAFIVWDKIHVWANDEDLGSLNDLRRIAPEVAQVEAAPPASKGRRTTAKIQKKMDEGNDSEGLGEESEDDDEGEWRTLDEIMKGEAIEEDGDEHQQQAEEGEATSEVPGAPEAGNGDEGRGVLEVGSEWACIDGKEVRVFGRPFLGFGAFAVVKRGEWMGVPVAIKSINKLKKGQYARGTKRELQMWWPARHPHIVSLYGALESESHIYIVMERLHINLGQTMERLSRQRVLENGKRWAMQIASAMHSLHSRGVLHRDLKVGNILLTKDFKSCKIADFGTAVDEREADNIIVGTTEYMAPEMHVRTPHSKKMDVYSFGVLLWKLFHPYTYPYPKHDPVSLGSGKRHRNHILKVVYEGARPVVNKTVVPPAWRELMEACWAADPEERPAFDEIVCRLKDLPNLAH